MIVCMYACINVCVYVCFLCMCTFCVCVFLCVCTLMEKYEEQILFMRVAYAFLPDRVWESIADQLCHQKNNVFLFLKMVQNHKKTQLAEYSFRHSSKHFSEKRHSDGSQFKQL